MFHVDSECLNQCLKWLLGVIKFRQRKKTWKTDSISRLQEQSGGLIVS